MEQAKGTNAARVAAIEAAATVAAAQWECRQEEARVQAIVAASQARQQRMLEPGQELDVQALMAAARVGELN